MIHEFVNKRAEDKETSGQKKAPARMPAFDYLRAFAVILELYHHAILAYTTFAVINFENPIATSSPVVNDKRWIGFDVTAAFNETFFMPLLFLISGIFVWQSLTKKGIRKYLSGRLTRLGLPFVTGVFFLIPLAYYPAKLQTGLISGTGSGYGAFWLGMIKSGFGTAGPLWFLWLLLAFNFLAAFLYRIAPFSGNLIRERAAIVFARPTVFYTALLVISMMAYLPVTLSIGPLKWTGIGPFHVQAGRILLYLVYFLAGTAAGAFGIDRSVFRSHGPLARHFRVWFAVSLLSFIVFLIMVVVVSAQDRTIASEIAFAVCCWAAVFGMTGLFLRFIKGDIRIFSSLSGNSYGIYIVHYVFITWLQYLLLGNSLSPCIKGTLVFLITLILSWGTAAVIRQIPVIARII